MGTQKLIPSRRSTTFLVIIISLIGLFFICYNFYYIPSNKNIQHKNGFLILANIQQNIKEGNEYLQTSFKNILQQPAKAAAVKPVAALQMQLDNYKIGAKILSSNVTDHGIVTDKEKQVAGHRQLQLQPASSPVDVTDSSVYLSGLKHDSLFYAKPNSSYNGRSIYVPAKNFMEPILAFQKTELFEAYLLIGKSSGIIYIDPGLAINTGITADSLIVKNNQSMFSGVKDINIGGVDYKLFYYPFRFGTEQVLLCGFIKTSAYFNKLNQVPVNFIYPIVIALVFIVILFPIMKFYLMGKDEHIKYVDFVFGLMSFFIGSAILTLIILQVLLLWAGDIRAKKNCTDLSVKIDKAFAEEIAKAYAQLDSFDYMMQATADSSLIKKMRNHQNQDVSDSIKKYFKLHAQKSYYNFNRVSWVDAEGDQHLKAEVESAELVYTNVSQRNYFKQLKNNGGFRLPGKPGAKFGLEAINSWTNGGFGINISIRSRLGRGVVAAMSVQMPSVMQTILPPGFGFCIIDNDGKVMVHSDQSRSLQENFIAKADPSRKIKEAVTGRQAVFFSDLNFYGKTHALYIKPIAGLPFNLISFYDKGYIVPVNMRIFTFSLLFCFISFALCLLLWYGVFRKKSYSNPVLYDPMFYLNSIVPKEKKTRFYTLGTYFLLVYLLFQVGVIFTFNYFGVSNYAILIEVVLLPVNIFSGLYVINHRVRNINFFSGESLLRGNVKKTIPVVFTQPLAFIFCYWYSAAAGYPMQAAFLYFGLFFFIFLWILYFLPKRLLIFLITTKLYYLKWYCIFTTLLLVCISVLPAAIYTWYAHNQEITQTVKKEQLYLAKALQQRSTANYIFARKRNALFLPDQYFENLQYQTGIYKIYNDSIIPNAEPYLGDRSENGYENFYFFVANDIGTNYYDPQIIPALQDSATDNAWYWHTKIKTIDFWYNLYSNPQRDSTAKANAGKALQISSTFPDRYVFVVKSLRGIVLVFFILFVIYGIYLLVEFISSKLFLRIFVPVLNQQPIYGNDAIKFLFAGYIAHNNYLERPNVLELADIEKLGEEYNYFIPLQNSRGIYKQEREMTLAQNKFRDFYFYIWDKLLAKEKYLLLDFAQHGLVNFKNTEVIDGLLQKGLFVIRFEEVKLFSISFRCFILSQKHSKEMLKLRKGFQQQSTWQTIRVPLLIIILGVAFFIFFTQEQTFQKITALVAGISTVLSILLKFFTDGAGLFGQKK